MIKYYNYIYIYPPQTMPNRVVSQLGWLYIMLYSDPPNYHDGLVEYGMGTHLSIEKHCYFSGSNCYYIFLWDGTPLTVLFLIYDWMVQSPFVVGKLYGKSPFFMCKSPFALGKSSFFMGKSPFLIGKSPFFMCKSPFVLGKSSCFMGKSPFLIGKSPFFMGKPPFFLGLKFHQFEQHPGRVFAASFHHSTCLNRGPSCGL